MGHIRKIQHGVSYIYIIIIYKVYIIQSKILENNLLCARECILVHKMKIENRKFSCELLADFAHIRLFSIFPKSFA